VVSIETEQALIVWDAAAGREHFVRRGRFASTAADFGFLVPTPGVPELAEAPDAVFDRLHAAVQPEVVRRTGLRPQPLAVLLLPFTMLLSRSAGAPEGMMSAAGPPQSVRVIDEKRVAGYQAVVLQADDPQALLKWLAEHHYDARPELQEWLVPYVAARWTITAFKVDAGAARTVATQAVRMSFATDRPFFPYREPADQRRQALGSRELLVYLVAAGRQAGSVGGAPWKAVTGWAGPRSDLGSLLAPALPAGTALAEGSWLNMLVDRQDPRPGTDDLFFARAADQAAVIPPPVVIDDRSDLPVPVDLLALGLVGGLWWRRRRARRA
jgi:hypothetical protein